MIENKNEASRNLEKALRALEQAKQRVVNKLIDKILISEPVEIDGEKIQRLTIHYRFVGALETLE